MPDTNDMDLLGDYARNGSETAFADLVQRHIPLVYSAALRHVGMAAQAEEITQAVFIILARKAGSLHPGTVLESWLYETTRLTALSFLRGERRRQFREQEAYMQSTLQETPENSAWNEMSPLLDEALARLGKKDRDAVILLQFFKEKSVRDVAMKMQMNETAAQRRILRALEKLRKYFFKRGVVSTTAVIAGAISANSVHAAPPDLAQSAAAAAVAKGAAASASTLTLIKGALKLMAWTKVKTAAVVSAVVLLTAGTTMTIVICNQAKPVQGIPKNWSVLSGDSDQWNWVNGRITGHTVAGDSILASEKEYNNVNLSVVAATTNREASLVFHMQDAYNGYMVIFAPGGTPMEDAGHIALLKREDGQETTLASYQGRIFSTMGQSAKISVITKGPSIVVRLNDVPVLRKEDSTFPSGYIGLRMYGAPDAPCDATFSNLTFR
jgi:RNA polymerase sigma factor (sigma-70 family)